MADDPIVTLAVGLNEDAKAARKKRGPANATEPQAAAVAGEQADDGDGDSDPGGIIADRIANIAEDAELDAGTLVGDLRDTLLDIYRTKPKPWGQMVEAEQKRVASALTEAAKAIVDGAVRLVAGKADVSFEARLESYTVKGGVTIKLSADDTRDNIMALYEAAGQYVMVRRIDPVVFSGQRRDVETDADQGGLPMAGGANAEHPDDDSDLAGDQFGEDGDPGATVRGEDGELAEDPADDDGLW